MVKRFFHHNKSVPRNNHMMTERSDFWRLSNFQERITSREKHSWIVGTGQYLQTPMLQCEIFDIQKGSKQGDPLSSLPFNTVLQYALKNVVLKWQRTKGMGIYLSDQDRGLPDELAIRRRRDAVRNIQRTGAKH